MKNILVAIDFENLSEAMVNMAAELAGKFGSKIWMLHIAAPDPDFVGNKAGPKYIRDFLIEEIRNEHKQLKKYADDLTAKGIQADGFVIQGPTIEMILFEIKKLTIDLLVIGHRPHSLLHRLFQENTHEALVNKAGIPVLIMPL